MTTMTFTIQPIPPDIVAGLRSNTDAVGITAGGGEPVRCCLRNATAGDGLLLVNYAPPLPPSPYRETGAIYLHSKPCGGPGDLNSYPEDWYGRHQVLRAYDEHGWIHPATTTHDGTDPVTSLADVLAQPGVVQVHSRNVAYGCFMFSATLTGPGPV